jgi:CMP/dCMP kinase
MTAGAGILAIDGPAGAGKSTVARGAADRLGFHVLDTGAMYRAATLACLRAAVDLDDERACGEIAGAIRIDQDGEQTSLDGVDVSREIRTPEVTATVSTVSAHPGVRRIMVDHQRRWAAGREGGVVEGRDIGTVVFPDARLKVFLLASDEERARRRLQDEMAAGRDVDLDALRAAIERRDKLDSERAHSPLAVADDAVQVDTTGRSVDDVVDEIVERYLKAPA